jgi:hypothetical protein
MSFINKRFKNKLTGDEFEIVDVYQNVAITSNKEKVNTSLLMNDKIFVPINSYTSMNESAPSNPLKQEYVDPSKFFDNQNTYNTFAQQIKSIPMDKIPDDNSGDGVSQAIRNSNPDFYQNVNNESAIIMADPEDEIEELKRKYGATSVDDSLRKQNEVFSRILEDPQQGVENTTPIPENNDRRMDTFQNQEPPIQRIEVQDPVITMFKNVKRNNEFKINLKIDGKIPRLDFIEMMEDSYEISIIEYLADEFTNNLLKDPSIIRDRIINEIKSMIDKKNGVSVKKDVNPQITDAVTSKESIEPKPVVKKTTNRKKTTPTSPSKNRLKEGKETDAPKNMNA